MARFSSVAYEDPPKNNANRGKMASEVEQFVDRFGVTITRPKRDEYKIAQNNEEHNRDGERSDESVWDMAHVNAMSPRPLMPMFSECNMSGMISDIDDNDIANARFQWVALATNEKTSAQFDVWRITAPSTSAAYNNKDETTPQKNDNILVVAFRGTRLSSYVDLLTDIQLRQDMIGCSELGVCMDVDDDDTTSEESSENNNNESMMAHSGFFKAYSSIRPTLLEILSSDDDNNIGTYDRLWFTGHSLGAALATLAVVDVGSLVSDTINPITIAQSTVSTSSSSSRTIPSELRFNLPKARVSSYLFGTPRVGNLAFASRLARLQEQPNPIIEEYYRINTPGDAVVYLPRGKVANRLDIDYVHAGASVFLPATSFPENREEDGNNSDGVGAKAGDNNLSDDTTRRQAKMNGSYSQWMMQLEEDTIEQINRRIFQARKSGEPTDNTVNGNNNISRTNIRIYPKGDHPPDPLSEVDPEYKGFFPVDPRSWISSTSFQDFLLGEAVRSFRILRGGFVKNHQLKTYEDGLCLASQDNVIVINPLR